MLDESPETKKELVQKLKKVASLCGLGKLLLQNPKLQAKMIELHQDFELLKMVDQGRTQLKNKAVLFKYFPVLIYNIYHPN